MVSPKKRILPIAIMNANMKTNRMEHLFDNIDYKTSYDNEYFALESNTNEELEKFFDLQDS